MQLLLGEDQKLIQHSAQSMLARAAGPKRMRSLREAGGFDRARWREIGEAGWLAVMLPEAAGGMGLGRTELCLVLQEAGKALLTDPLAAAAAAALALSETDSEALRAGVLAKLVAGEIVVLPAFQEGPLAADPGATTVTARRDGTGFALSGTKRFIASAAVADGFLVNAQAPDGIVLAYVPADAAGLVRSNATTVDGCGLGAIEMKDVAVPDAQIVAGPNRAPGVVARATEAALIGHAAELLGIMDQAHAIALDYIKTRVQFGRPIGAFQVLQHRAVNLYVEVEMMRSFLFQAAGAMDTGRAAAAALATALKARASAAALEVTKASIQLHGAIGFTDEHDIGLYFRRAIALAAQWGNAAEHRARFAALALEAED